MMLNQDSVEVKEKGSTIWKVNCEYTSYYVIVTTGETIYVNWGDGNVQEITNHSGQISHYFEGFPEGQDYFQIQITGNHTQVNFYTSGSEIYVTELISGAKTLRDYYQMCYQCSNLKTVANTFFIYGDQSINCNLMFRQSGIEKINHDLFKYTPDQCQCDCTSMFQYCYSLSQVNTLSLPVKSKTEWMFGQCYNLINVDAQKLVEKWTTGHAASHYYMFYDCYNMTGVFNQNYWWAQFDGGPVNWYSFGYSGIFFNCTSLSNYEQIPDSWKN